MTRDRAMWIFLALIALWPIAQNVLVQTMHVSRWELGAFGMYTVPELDVAIELAPALEHDTTELGDESRMIGLLASPEPLAREILAAHPELDRVVITRRWRTLGADGRLHERVDRFQSQPPPPDDPP